jgi:hypothetical protein
MPTAHLKKAILGIFPAMNLKLRMQKPRRILAASMAGALAAGAVFTPCPTQGQSDLLPPPNLLAPARPAAAAGAAPARTAVPAASGVPARAAVPAAAPIPGLNAEDPLVTSLVADVVEQQVKIADNQKHIDEKLAVIAENLRIARIYASRAK